MRYDSEEAVNPSQWSEVVYFTLYGPWEQPGIHTPLFIGPHSTVNAGNNTYPSHYITTITRISDTQAVIGYSVESPTTHVGTYVSLITVSSNNTVTRTAPLKIGSDTQYVHLTTIDENRVLVAWAGKYVKILNVINNTITSPNNNTGVDIPGRNTITLLSSTKVLIAGKDYDVRGCILTISSMNSSTKKTTIVVGTIVSLQDVSASVPERWLFAGGTIQISENKVLITTVERDPNVGNYDAVGTPIKIYGRLLTISGNNIVKHNEYYLTTHINNHNAAVMPRPVILPSGLILMMCYNYIHILTVDTDNNTITCGAPMTYSARYVDPRSLSAAIIGDNKIVIVYNDTPISGDPTLAIQTVTVFPNGIISTSVIKCNNWESRLVNIAQLSSDKILVSYVTKGTTYISPYVQLLTEY